MKHTTATTTPTTTSTSTGNMKGSSALVVKSFISHLLACVMGGMLVDMWKVGQFYGQSMMTTTHQPVFVSTNNNYYYQHNNVTTNPSTTSSIVPSSSSLSSSSVVNTITPLPKTLLWDVVPIVVIESGPSTEDMRVLLAEIYTRVRYKSQLTTGPIIIYYPANKEEAEEEGIKTRKQVHGLAFDVDVRSIPNTTTRRDVLLSVELWEDLVQITKKVLVVDISAVLCSNPTYPISWFIPKYDWIGAAWHFAQDDPSSIHHLGGNGAVSIRSPIHLLEIMKQQRQLEKEQKNIQPPNSNEDMYFVSQLRQWYDSNHTTRNGIPPPKLPSFEHQRYFSVEVVPTPHDSITPCAVYHLMIVMSFVDRERTIQSCPEAKRLFQPLHESSCTTKFQCPKNMTKYNNKFEWENRQQQEDFDINSESCHVLYHPVANVVEHQWSHHHQNGTEH